MDTVSTAIGAVRDCGVPDLQIVVVDDASTVGTADLLKGPLGTEVDIVVHHSLNMGREVLKAGIKMAKGFHIIFQDTYLEYSPNEYSALIDSLRESGADAAYRPRVLGRGLFEVSPFWQLMVNGFLTLVSNFFTGYRITDMQTSFKLFPSEFLKSVEFEEN